jgi:uncharacterized membrane protein YesL
LVLFKKRGEENMLGFKLTNDKQDIEKRSSGKSRTLVFFELLFRKFWDLCKVNLLYVVSSIPTFLFVAFLMGIFSSKITDYLAPAIGDAVSNFPDIDLSLEIAKTDAGIRCMFALWFGVLFGTGPSTAGVTYILRNFAREEHAFILSDWWEHTRSNFGQAITVWIIDIFAVFGMCIAILFYGRQGSVMFAISIVLGYILIVYTLVRLYLYQVMITFRCAVVQLFKNSFTLLMQELPKIILLLLIIAAIHIAFPCAAFVLGFSEWLWLLFIVAELICLPTITTFMVNYFIYPKIKKYININKQE